MKPSEVARLPKWVRDETARQMAEQTKPAPSPAPEPPDDDYRSGLEREYAAYLARQPDVGDVRYEAVRFEIGPDCTYTPDFRVVVGRTTLHYQFHEVKGGHRWRREGLVKLKVAAQMFREYRWFLAERVAGQWRVKEIVP